MLIPEFDPTEIKSTGAGEMPTFDFPVTPRKGYIAAYQKKPVWFIMLSQELARFTPRVNPDNVARAFVIDGSGMRIGEGGGKDMFGIEWEYVPQAGGSMVRPGRPLLSDANEWYEKLVWPDIDSWNWEPSAKENENFLSDQKFNQLIFMNGWYERLISFMDFEGAVVAMIDEDQKNAITDLFDKLSDLYIRILEKYLAYFPAVDEFCFHDDWGSQKETFFSPDVVAELIVPAMKKVTDFIHSKGKYCSLHSCGQILRQVPNIIAAGWDSWNPQSMNDIEKIYDLYGDQLLIGVMPELSGLKDIPEVAQRERARKFAEKYCDPNKPAVMNFYASMHLTPVFLAELYKSSRLCYAGT